MPQTPPIGLDEATRLEGEGDRFSTRLDKAWEIWGPSGGYLAAIALRAAGRLAEIPRPASFYGHFLSAPTFDDVELRVEMLKRGATLGGAVGSHDSAGEAHPPGAREDCGRGPRLPASGT